MGDAKLRQKVIEIRARSLPLSFLDNAARQVLVASVTVPGPGQRLAFMRVLGDTIGPQISNMLDRSHGKTSPELQSVAQSIALWGNNFDTKQVPEFSDTLKNILNAAAEGKTVSAADIQAFKGEINNVKASRQENEDWLKLNSDSAKEQGKAILDTLWGQVVPSFETLDKTPEVTKLSAEPLKGGGFQVTGQFKSGALFGSEGSFSVQLSDLGAPDIKSLSVDVGEKFIKQAAEAGVKQQLSMLADGGNINNVEIDRAGKAPDQSYQLSGSVEDSGRYSRFSIAVSAMGMIDPSSIKLS